MTEDRHPLPAPKPSVVVLASGGVDSAVLLARAQRDGTLAGICLFDYGHPAFLFEHLALQSQIRHLGITAPLHEVPLAIHAFAMRTPSGQRGPRVVPHRNLIMLAHALNWAVALGADEVQYGAIHDDRHNYADCRPTFWLNLNHALIAFDTKTMQGESGPRVAAPLSATAKAHVVREAHAFGILPLCWSCYAPTAGGKPCGGCDSCVSRTDAEQMEALKPLEDDDGR